LPRLDGNPPESEADRIPRERGATGIGIPIGSGNLDSVYNGTSDCPSLYALLNHNDLEASQPMPLSGCFEALAVRIWVSVAQP